MKKKYTRLKLKMLFFVFIGAVAAAIVGVFLLEWLFNGALGDLLSRLYVMLAETIFGQTHAQAMLAYQRNVLGHREQIIMLAIIMLILVGFYVAMGRFTRWLDEIRDALGGMVSGGGMAAALPQELAPIQGELTALRTRLEEQAAERLENQKRKADMVAFLAHDLKTPLTSVVGYLSLLNEKPNLTPEQRGKYTGIALDKALRLEELLGEFFDISRMDLQSDPTEREPIQLSILLEQLADEFFPIFEEKSLGCQCDITSGMMIEGDPDKLARVFDNVLRNAVSYSTPGGTVSLTAGPENGNVEIAISNEGMEIPEQELSNIFDKFYRLDAARNSRTGGAGLGLAIAKEIVEGHGGTIHAECNGRRTTFHISLPLKELQR